MISTDVILAKKATLVKRCEAGQVILPPKYRRSANDSTAAVDVMCRRRHGSITSAAADHLAIY